mmetsp:Transcript_21175/g.49222  ORF Transcript_21175/g.49222 Transcript_21175/m.49222 type:complete len:286 (-) Transcript_21175:113-970(-)
MGFCACVLPIWGTFIFVLNPNLWKPLIWPFIVVLGITIAAFVLIPMYGLKPQQDYLHQKFDEYNVDQRVVDVISYLLVPLEAGLISCIIFLWLFGSVKAGIINQVLKDRGVHDKLMQRNDWQEMPTDAGGPSSGLLMFLQAILMVGTLPINFWPLVGQVLYFYINGWMSVWQDVSSFLPLIGYSAVGTQLKHVLCHPISYSCFGFVSFASSVIPFANIVLCGPMACGVALLFEGFVGEGRDGPDPLPVPKGDGSGNSKAGAKAELLQDTGEDPELPAKASSKPTM